MKHIILTLSTLLFIFVSCTNNKSSQEQNKIITEITTPTLKEKLLQVKSKEDFLKIHSEIKLKEDKIVNNIMDKMMKSTDTLSFNALLKDLKENY